MYDLRVQLLALFLIVKSLYVPLNRRASRFYWKLPLDDRIPLLPWFVVPYIGFFVFIGFSIFLVWNTQFIQPLLASLLFAYVVAFAVWYLFPNGVKRPEISGTGLFHRILRFIYKTDHDTNAFPSGHVFVTLICAYYVSLGRPEMALAAWTIAVSIVLSTLFTKQHYVVDIVGGTLVFFLTT